MHTLVAVRDASLSRNFHGECSTSIRNLTTAELEMVADGINWGAVRQTGNSAAVGGAAAGAVGGLVAGMMGTPITAGASIPVGVGLGAMAGFVTGWYGGAASEIYNQLQ